MSQLLWDCQINITQLLCRVENYINNKQQKVNNAFRDTFKTLAERTMTKKQSPVVCERFDCEISLTVKRDKHGLLLIPQGTQTVLKVSSTERCKKTYIVSPIPSRKKLKLNTSKVMKRCEKQSNTNDSSPAEIITSQPTSSMSCISLPSKERSKQCTTLEHPEFLPPINDMPEKRRLDFSTPSRTELDLDPIKCDTVSEQKKSHGEDRLSSYDSGYENSDLEEVLHSPALTECDVNCTFERELSSSYEMKIGSPVFNLKETCSKGKDMETTKMVLFDNVHINCSTGNRHKNVTDWIAAQSPYVGKTPLVPAFRSTVPGMTPVIKDDNHKTASLPLNVYEFDNDSYSTIASFPICDYTQTSNDTLGIHDELNNTHLHQELAQALVQEVEDLSGCPADICSSNDQDVNTAESPDEHILNASCIVRTKQLNECQDELLSEINMRKDELHEMVDMWHHWITNKIALAYDQEQKRQSGELQRINLVQGVRSPTKIMYTVLNTKHKLNKDLFGTFTSHVTIQERQCSPQKLPHNYFMSQTKHVRTFETRDDDSESKYMATSVNVDVNNHYTVTDLGADTCRVFTSEGCLVKDLDVSPLDEPTYAITNENNQTLLACRTGLKLYKSNSIFSCKLAVTDIKCPQTFAFDKLGNYVVSDMHDCGSAIVTLEKNTLYPLRMFCSAQYDSSPEAFTSAWYIHITADDCIVLSDREDHMIKCYTQHGEYLWSAGGLGAEPGLFFTPAGITQDRLGNILVADCNNDRVQIFSQHGEWLGVVVSKDSFDITGPMDLAIDSNDNLIVLQSNGSVSVFSYMKR